MGYIQFPPRVSTIQNWRECNWVWMISPTSEMLPKPSYINRVSSHTTSQVHPRLQIYEQTCICMLCVSILRSLELELSEHVGFWVEMTSSSGQHRGKEFESSHGICSAPPVCAFWRFPNTSYTTHQRTCQNTSMIPCLSHRSCLFLDKPMILSITRQCRLSASLRVWGNVWTGKELSSQFCFNPGNALNAPSFMLFSHQKK